jgi:hypothetical protein
MEVIKTHKLSGDYPSHYVILNDQGEEFKVAKHSLDPLTNEKIANLQKIEGFAEGGEVDSQFCPKCGYKHPNCQCYASGGKVECADCSKGVCMAHGGSVPGYADGAEVPQAPMTPVNPGVVTAPSLPGFSEYLNKVGSGEVAPMQPNMPAETPPTVIPDNRPLSHRVFGVDTNKEIGFKKDALAKMPMGSPEAKALEGEISGLENKMGVAKPMEAARPVPKEEIAGVPHPQAQEQQQQQVDPMALYKAAAIKQMGAAQEYANSMANIGKQVAKVQNEAYEALAQRQQYTQEAFNKLQEQSQKMIADGASGKINPDQHWENRSTGSKIMANLGIILGGMGAFATGGKNLALENIQKLIDNDIQAQKANLAHKDTLLGRNLQLTGNMIQAEQLTSSQLQSMVAAKVAGLQAQSIGPEAKMKLAEFNNQILNNLQSQQMQMAKYQSNMRLMGMGGQSATWQDVAANPELQPKAVQLPSGHIGLAATEKEGQDLRDKMAKNKNVFGLLKQLEELGPDTPISATKRDEAKRIMSRLEIQMMQSDEFKRLGPELIKNIKEQFNDPTSWKNVVGLDSKTKTSNLMKDFQDEFLNEAGSKLINYTPPTRPRKFEGKE